MAGTILPLRESPAGVQPHLFECAWQKHRPYCRYATQTSSHNNANRSLSGSAN